MQKLIAALPDTLIVAGCCLIAYGAWALHPAAGYITGGALSLALGFLAEKQRPKAAE